MTIDEMLASPGLYEVANDFMRERGLSVLVQVDPDGRAHQINDEGMRDGVLSRDGWTPDATALRIFE